MALNNLFETGLPAASAGEQVDCLLAQNGVRIERIVSRGDATPPGQWYDQDRGEWVAVLQGTGTLAFENGRLLPLEPGAWVFLPAHMRHRVESTSADPPCIWLAVHVPQQESAS